MTTIGVLVVDDSVVIRRMVSSVLDDDPDINVVGTASNGRIALDKLAQLRPDIVILDVEMPVMDGLATLRALRLTHPKLPVVMFSALTERGAMATLDALAAGATDYVTKPSHAGSVAASIERVRLELIPKVKGLVGANRARTAPRTTPVVPVTALRSARQDRVDVIAVGCSTGGPDALTSIVAGLPKDFAKPVVVVQHMPPLFTRLFAERLNRSCPLTVSEAVDGQVVRAGHIIVAPGDKHLTVRRQGTEIVVVLGQEPPENYCRPSVDVLFRSVAEIYGGGVLACVLTGMGHDGASGAARIRAAGGRVVVQDEASSVVWGMPGSVVAAGHANDIVPLDRIAETLRNAVIPGARPSSGRVLPASAPRAVDPAFGLFASSRRVGGGTP
ncbi:MAG: two-component system, chemotaxis family, protein-glutamate methylesterase/glutaminase [Actinomycetota bacterium]|nr:two-component system, chemotaxis family, protein-glutamate methylesterase/glutaminase [Actinomycetota bacterium]